MKCPALSLPRQSPNRTCKNMAEQWDFTVGPVVKTSPSNVGRGEGVGVGSIPGQGARIPPALQAKKQRRSNIVTNSTKEFKNGPHQKKSLEKKLWLSKMPLLRLFLPASAERASQRQPRLCNQTLGHGKQELWAAAIPAGPAFPQSPRQVSKPLTVSVSSSVQGG